MNQKNIGILVVVLAVVAVGVSLLEPAGVPQKPDDSRLGQALVAMGDPTKIDGIDVIGASQTLSLVKADDGRWTMGEDGFPVDAGRVAQLMDSLAKAKHVRLAASEASELAPFDLTAGSGSRIVIKQGSEVVINLQLGSLRQGGGQYVRHGEETRAYLASEAVNAARAEDAWELKTLIDLDKDQVASVDFLPVDGPPVTLTRRTRDDQLTALKLKDSEEVNSGAMQALSVFSGLKFRTRHDPSLETAKAALEKPSRINVTLFDGRQYSGWVGTIGEEQAARSFIKLAANLEQGEWSAEQRAAAVRLNGMMDRWAFEISSHVAAPLKATRDKYVQPKSS